MAENIEVMETPRPYVFRPLNATDIMPMFRIIGKIGIDEFSDCFNSSAVQSVIANSKNGANSIAEKAGIQIFLGAANVIIKNLPDCEGEIFELLASVSNLSVDEIRSLGFVTFTRMIIEFVKKEEFRDFIGVVSELFN